MTRVAESLADDPAARLRRLAGEVGAFWGEGIPVAVEDGAPSFDWRLVRIPPEEIGARDDEELVCLLLHEWGHRCLAPRTIDQGLWWELLARMEGIVASRAAVNILCDLLVDRWYLEHAEWGAAYRRAERRALDRLLALPEARARAQGNPALGLLLACYERLGGWQELLGDLRLDRELAARCLDALFDESRPLEERVRDFLHEGASALRSPFELRGGRGRRGAPEGEVLPPLLGSLTPWIGPAWNAGALIRRLAAYPLTLPPAVLEEVLGAEAASEARAGLRVLASLLRVERQVDRAVESIRQQRAEGSELWRIGDPAHELDALLTLERAGLLLPGLTTLKRRRAARPAPRPKLPRLVLVVDNSGSTAGEILAAELDAAVALLEAARRLGVDVGLVVFGSSVHAAVDPGPHHGRIARLLAALNGQSGGTELAPALRRVRAMLPPEPEPMGTVVFSDSWVFDGAEAALQVGDLLLRGPVVLFLSDTSYDSSFLAHIRALRPGPSLVLHRPGQALVDETLRVLQ